MMPGGPHITVPCCPAQCPYRYSGVAMSLTRRPRSLLAGPRRESASVLTVVLLVLAVLSVHFLCSVHVDGQARSASHSHVAAVQGSGQETAPTETSAVDVATAPLGGGPHGCSDHHAVTEQCDPVMPSSPGPAVVPDFAVQWLVSDMALRESPAWSSGTVAAAPSLHALGISRT